MTWLKTWRTMPQVLAECQGCDWHADAAGTTNSDNARARAKAHALSTGHHVRVERTIITHFELRHD